MAKVYAKASLNAIKRMGVIYFAAFNRVFR